MKITTFEATVENGKIVLPENIHLPENIKVYVVVPGVELQPAFYIGSPHLVHPGQATDFVKEIIEEASDAVL